MRTVTMSETLPARSGFARWAGTYARRVRVLIALDKFRGTVTAAEATAAVGHACWELGHDADEAPMSDGGEGLLDVLGGANRSSIVTGPLGAPVEAGWRLDRRSAVIEMARASGLTLAGGPEGNDPLNASTVGTGQLIDRALEQGARHVIVGLGGSATTDGGLGALDALRNPARLRAIDLQVACDVRTTFVDAAAVFAPQKGATPAQVALLTARLEGLAERYRTEHGVDVRELPGSGAAGGLAGGLAAVGGRLVPGFDLVAEHVALDERVATADVVVTGEGYLDAQSLDGKVVGGVVALAADAGRPLVVIVGDADTQAAQALARLDGDVTVMSLVERYGEARAFTEPRWCIEHAAAAALAG
jgi:glycerate 2-kinase